MKFSEIFKKETQKIIKNNQKNLENLSKEEKSKRLEELKEKNYWKITGLALTEYIVGKIVDSIGRIDYKASTLSFIKDRKIKDLHDITPKMLSESNGGPSQADFYNSALSLSRKLNFKEVQQNYYKNKKTIITPYNSFQDDAVISSFVKNKLYSDLQSVGVGENEIKNLSEHDAFEMLKIKNIEIDLQESKDQRPLSAQKIEDDSTFLRTLWDYSIDAVDNVCGDKKTKELLNITASKNTEDLKKFLQNKDLLPEEKFFIEISIHLKNLQSELIENFTVDSEVISDHEFNNFVDKNEVSDSIINEIVNSIIAQKLLSERQMAIYTYFAKEIEHKIKNLN